MCSNPSPEFPLIPSASSAGVGLHVKCVSQQKKSWRDSPISTLHTGLIMLIKHVTGTGSVLYACWTASPISIHKWSGSRNYNYIRALNTRSRE